MRPLQRSPGCAHVPALRLPQGAVFTSASAAPSTNVAEWRAAVHEGAVLVMDAMDCQTEVLGELASEMYGLRQAVERLLSSSTSSL